MIKDLAGFRNLLGLGVEYKPVRTFKILFEVIWLKPLTTLTIINGINPISIEWKFEFE